MSQREKGFKINNRCQSNYESGPNSMIGENRQLVTDEPVEFEKYPVEIQDCRKITGGVSTCN